MTSYDEIVRRIREELQNSEDNYLEHFESLEELTKRGENPIVRVIEDGKVSYFQGCIDTYRRVIQIMREELRK